MTRRATGVEARAGIGARVRDVRRSVGMTQVELAAGRFTKQYVSQIERGETLPSAELLDWLAERLGVERLLLETGFTSVDLEKMRGELAAGQRLLDEHRYAEAADVFRTLRESLPDAAPRWATHGAACGEVWALIRLGRLTEAGEELATVRAGAEGGGEGTVEEAELAYLTGVCRYMGSDISGAHIEYANALELLRRADEPSDRLRVDIHQWRSRCYRRQRDWEAAREDVDRALELCAALDDVRRSAEVNLQASLVAERQGRWVLARRYAETSRALFDSVGDTLSGGRALNNVAGLNHLLDDDATAIAQLREAFAIFVDAHQDAEAGYALSSLAEIHRGRGELAEAELAAQRALELLEGRVDHIQEIGTAQLVIARAQLEQGDLERADEMLAAVDESYAVTESTSHQALAWMTRGELELLRENDVEAARLYRQAAIALQPVDL